MVDIGNIVYEIMSEGVVYFGMVLDEFLILEIVWFGIGDLVVEGEVGEVVVMFFNFDYLFICFGIGDLLVVV